MKFRIFSYFERLFLGIEKEVWRATQPMNNSKNIPKRKIKIECRRDKHQRVGGVLS